MLNSYFQYRSDLAKTDCQFKCPQTCDAPGCRSSDIIVKVTIFDLIGLNPILDASVSSIFSHRCRFGLENIEFNPRYKRLILKLIKPCHFHQKRHCAVHDSKPLNCILFPEYHQINNISSTLKSNPVFADFPCLGGDIAISEKRRHALKTLRRISRHEEGVSCYFLLGMPSFIIDSKPLSRELKIHLKKKEGISHQDYDDLVVKKLKQIGYFNRFMEKLIALDSSSEIERIFKMLNQDDLSKSIAAQGIKPKTIHLFKKDGVRKLKRRLGPRTLTHLVL